MEESTETPLTMSAGGSTEDGSLPRAVYRFASRLDNASLRLLDAGVIVVSWLLAYLAGYEGHFPRHSAIGPLVFLAIPLVIQLVANHAAGLYGPVWKYASVEEAARVVAAVAIGAAASTAVVGVLAKVTDTMLPVFTTPPVAALLMLLGCGGIRFQARLFALERGRVGRTDNKLRTLIVGAGSSGVSLAVELGKDARSDLRVVGFVDDTPHLSGRTVRGVRVLGRTSDLERICKEEKIERVIIALPNISRAETQAMMDLALKTDAQVKVLPRASDLVNGPLLRSLRDIDVADLLGREHAPVDSEEIAEYLEGATVLVTGAGGSIGSEIARQVARFQPGRLLLLDRDETLLHEVVSDSLADAVPVLGDLRNQTRIREIFERYRPDVVFHAGAQKHVPILERHPAEAVHTNVLGTWWLATIAAECGCGRFVHVSTDKAANPCSVMGSTKRAAELVVHEVGDQFDLPFAAVRFGNVLGSRGSVVPTFLRQILAGGPVTVTNPEMTRYFMTIPEAVSLVLQAGAMADEGNVFLLEMGKPVSIIDLAKQMIRLAGLRPGEDIEIKITGPRPGERLHEQLHDDAEIVDATRHPSIKGVVPKSPPDRETVFFFLALLEQACTESNNDAAIASLLGQLLRHSGIDCHLELESAPSTASGRITKDLRPTRATRLPALLGGRPRFSEQLPFARPARPPLEQVFKRIEPSYESGMLTNGPLVRELEARAAQLLEVEHVVAVSSCTSGLMLTLQAVTGGRTGPVVLPSFTFSASAHAVAWNGRTPSFVDCEADSLQISTEDAAEALDGASAILATHVFGAPCDVEQLTKLAKAAGVPLVFDAAHAFGARFDDRPVGGHGVAEVFSLTPTKVLVAGEGGLVATNDEMLAELLRIGRDYGNPGDYNTRFAGLNARMSEFHAAMALESLEMLDTSLMRRRQLAARYQDHLADVPGVAFQTVRPGDLSTYKDFSIVIDPDKFGLTRDKLVSVLTAEGIDTRKYFDPPVHRQHTYSRLEPVDLPVTDSVASSVLSLPIYPGLRGDEIRRVAESIRTAHTHAVELDEALSFHVDTESRPRV
ncbi:MAG TPA: aminotransferase class I/II-fold pyridoxal phosphate-dependent enzyme [Acidimicrobiia bacterium]|nr:aminotransferase class I/II-fold pyridoxal phosphate-dependent enzyme [Acidimicrobiia bacterium]